MNTKLILALSSASAIALLALTQPWSTSAERIAGPLATMTVEPSARETTLSSATKAQTAQSLPGAALLKNVDIIGGLDLHHDGNLAYTLALRHLFDHFLGMAGNVALVPVARETLEMYLRSDLNVGRQAIAQAMEAFDLYVEYLRGAEQVELSSYEAGDLERTFDVLFNLRRTLLGNHLAEAFFSDDEAREQLVVAQRHIAADPSLSQAERAKLFAELEQTLPPNLQEIRQRATVVARLHHEAAALRSAGATDAAIQQMREQQVGYEAAARLEELDRQRSEWNSRLEGYQRERNALLASGALAPGTHVAALDDLRARLFTEPEARRVAALERSASLRR